MPHKLILVTNYADKALLDVFGGAPSKFPTQYFFFILVIINRHDLLLQNTYYLQFISECERKTLARFDVVPQGKLFFQNLFFVRVISEVNLLPAEVVCLENADLVLVPCDPRTNA